MSKYTQIYPRYTMILEGIQNAKRRRGRPALPGPEGPVPVGSELALIQTWFNKPVVPGRWVQCYLA